MPRDSRIDIIRGAGVLMIALDHLAGTMDRLAAENFTVPFITWSRIGWSSAAEFFVFFSGYLVGLVYANTVETRGMTMAQSRACHRAWQIYATNVLTALCVLLILYATPIGNAAIIESSYFARLLAADGSGWVAFLTLQQAPMFFEILQLYVLLILIAPLVLAIARTSLPLALVLSAAVWLAAQLNPSLTIRGWTFNPFAWQFVFVLGMLFSRGRFFERLPTIVPRSVLIGACATFVFAAGAIKFFEKTGVSLPLIGTFNVVGIDKATLGPLRLIHFLVSAVLIMELLPRSGPLLSSLVARAVARIGQHSLECFSMSTILVYVFAGLLWNALPITAGSLFFAGLSIMVLLCLFAAFMAWIRREPWRGDQVRKPNNETAEKSPRHADTPTIVSEQRSGFAPGVGSN